MMHCVREADRYPIRNPASPSVNLPLHALARQACPEVGSTDRQHPRIAADVGIQFYVGTQQVADGRTLNVSRGGLCADLTSSLPIGKDVDVEMRLVFEDKSQSEALRLPARIVWCTMFEGAYQVGISFRPFDKQRAEYLAMFLKYLGEHDKPSRSKKATNIDDRFR